MVSSPVSVFLAAVKGAVVDQLVAPGDWLTGAHRRAVWFLTRGERPVQVVDNATAAVVTQVGQNPGDLSPEWATAQMAALGGGNEAIGRYVELVGVTAMAVVVDRFDIGLGAPAVDVPPPMGGEPARQWPDGLGDVGAWVPQTLEKRRANVSRALTAAPVTAAQWATLLDAFYSRGEQFNKMVWDRALSRPQVELVAARTTSLHRCFY